MTENESFDDNNDVDNRELEQLLGRVRGLPREVSPTPESWEAIRTRIDASRVRELSPRAANSAVGTNVPGHKSWWRGSRSVLAAAAVLFVSVTTFAVMRDGREEPVNNAAVTVADPSAAIGDNAPPRDSSMPSVASPAGKPETPHAAVASMRAVFAQYDEATSDLARNFAERRTRLQPEAVAVLDSCLMTIDRAISESRSALAAEPTNTIIAELLQVTYQQKIDLLRRAGDLPMGSL